MSRRLPSSNRHYWHQGWELKLELDFMTHRVRVQKLFLHTMHSANICFGDNNFVNVCHWHRFQSLSPAIGLHVCERTRGNVISAGSSCKRAANFSSILFLALSLTSVLIQLTSLTWVIPRIRGCYLPLRRLEARVSYKRLLFSLINHRRNDMDLQCSLSITRHRLTRHSA